MEKKLPFDLNNFEQGVLRSLFEAQQPCEHVSLNGLKDKLREFSPLERAGVLIPEDERKSNINQWFARIRAQVGENVGEEIHPILRIKRPVACVLCDLRPRVGRSDAFIFQPED
jgi:hypothetical protein